MIRTSSFALKFSNTTKKDELRDFLSEYLLVVNFYIERLWKKGVFVGSFIPKEIQQQSTSWISQRAKQCAGKQALQIVKSQRKKKRKAMPMITNRAIELDGRFIEFLTLDSFFDEFVKFSSLGNKLKVVCPIKHHKHYNKLLSNGFTRKKSVRLREHNGNLYLDVFLEKEMMSKNTKKTIGIDIGIKKLITRSDCKAHGTKIENYMEKIQRKKHGSKAFKRALKERDNYVNQMVNRLPDDCNYVLENIKDIHKGTKKNKRMRKEFRSKFQRWTYSQLLRRIQLRAELLTFPKDGDMEDS